MLLRALLVATVSSHSWLLKPALRVLSLLAHPRVSLLDVNKNPLLRQILKMTFYNHFCAGESGAGVQSTIRKIKDMGFRGGDFDLRERIVIGASASKTKDFPTSQNSHSESAQHPDIAAWRESVLETVALDLMREYNQKGVAVVYNTYQAYLKSTPVNLLSHLELAEKEGFTIGIKLVRGAYIASEPRALINDTKPETDHLYNTMAEGIIRRQYGSFGSGDRPFPSAGLFLATHNKKSVLKADQMSQEQLSLKRPMTKTQYGQLLGMADGFSCRLLQLGQEMSKTPRQTSPEVFKCLSWGTLKDCLSYLLRRAVENRDGVGRTKEEYLLLKQETMRRLKRGFM